MGEKFEKFEIGECYMWAKTREGSILRSIEIKWEDGGKGEDYIRWCYRLVCKIIYDINWKESKNYNVK